MNEKQRCQVKEMGRLLSKQSQARQGEFVNYLEERITMEYKEKVMTIAEVAEYLGLKKVTVYQLLNKHRIKATKTFTDGKTKKGGKWLILESAVIEFLKGMNDKE